jgi:SAM-dependent methyltransferase
MRRLRNWPAVASPADAGRREGPCAACGAQSRTQWGSVGDRIVYACAACGTLSFEPSGTSYAYAEHYPLDAEPPPEVHRSLAATVATFAPYRATNRFLEVGFGAGFMLEVAASAGWEVAGLETSQSALARARHRGFQVFEGPLESASLPSAAFDVVVAFEVIEHVEVPRSFVERLAESVRPGGLVSLTTPNARGVSARVLRARWSIVDPDDHVHLFSAQGLRTLLNEAGLLVRKSISSGVNPYELVAGLRKAPTFTPADRVEGGHELLGRVESSWLLRLTRHAVNGGLRVTGLGDTLKVRAERPRRDR